MDFCGCDFIVHSDPKGKSSKECFKDFENGKKDIITNQPNIFKGVIIGKKSWGLHVKMWSEGIGDGEFRLKDILEDFERKHIIIPEPLLKDFENTIRKRIIKNIENGEKEKLYFSYILNHCQ